MYNVWDCEVEARWETKLDQVALTPQFSFIEHHSVKSLADQIRLSFLMEFTIYQVMLKKYIGECDNYDI